MAVIRTQRLFAVVLLTYALGSQLAFAWFGADGINPSFFPAAGVTFAALVCVPTRQWWAVLTAAAVAELGADLAHGLSLSVSLGYVAANVAQPLVGAALLRRRSESLDMARTTDLVRFFGWGALVAPVVGAALGASTYVLIDGGTGWARFAAEWWVGDGLGILVVGGSILAWRAEPRSDARWPEAVLLTSATIGATAVMFAVERFGLMSVPVALMMATAVRVGTKGVAVAGAGAGFAAAAMTANGHLVFAADTSPAAGLLYVQLAIGVTLATALGLAAEISAREQVGRRTAEADAMRRQQAAIADRRQLLSAVGEVMDSTTTVADRSERLVALLVAERGWRATVVVGTEAVTSTPPPGGDASEDVLTVELWARGARFGELQLDGAAEHVANDPGLIEALAAKVAVGLDNALVFERERNTSHAFQAALLGARLRSSDQCQLSAAYLPASGHLQVGGDWHDAFWLPDGHLVLVVGDVVGHGLDAAIAMGQLRAAVRSLGSFSSPAQVLDHLDDYVSNAPEARCATLTLVEVDPRSGRMALASAGHPPPLLVPAVGPARFLWGGRSTPIGVASGRPRGEAVVLTDAGDTLVLYTDGLVERRGATLEDGMQRLEAAAQDAISRQTEDVAGDIVADLTAGSPAQDDICVLLARVNPANEPFRWVMPAQPQALAEARAALRRWAIPLRMPEAALDALILATGEASANAVEHAYEPGAPGWVEINASVADDGTVSVLVRDDGRWADRPPGADRGRGLAIMRTAMDEVHLQAPSRGGSEIVLTCRI